MRLDESVGENSEYYSDDEEISQMENELRDSYKSINSQFSENGVEAIGSNGFEQNSSSGDYDELLNLI